MPARPKPAAEIGCPLCGTGTRVHGPIAPCPTGHELDVTYGHRANGTPFPVAARSGDGVPPTWADVLPESGRSWGRTASPRGRPQKGK
jgi:hypothetical protein